MLCVVSDKDNNSAVVSLGEPYSETAAAQHLLSTGSPPAAPSTGDMTMEETLAPHRATVHRCGSPPTGRSVSFMCGQADRGDAETSGAARMSGRRQSEQKDTTTAVSVPVTGSRQTQPQHVDDEKPHRLKSVGSDAVAAAPAVCPSSIHVCKCVNSLSSSKASDVKTCRPVSDKLSPCDVVVVEVAKANESHIVSEQTAAPDCCVVHV